MVRIVERTPVGVVQRAHGFTLVDAAKVPISTTDERPAGYPLIDRIGRRRERAVGFRGGGERAERASRRRCCAQVDTITATTPDDVSFTLREAGRVVWGSAEDSALKAADLPRCWSASPDQQHVRRLVAAQRDVVADAP